MHGKLISATGVQFKRIEEFPMYCVGDNGSVWSSHKGVWKQLKPGINKKSGHLHVVLCGNGVKRSVSVHRLVIEYFKGPCPEGLECLHDDGIPAHNHVSNLRYGTRLENCADTVRHGRTTLGEKNPRARLTREQVLEIKQKSIGGVTGNELAAMYGVHPATISMILTGKNWKEVTL